MSAPTFNLPVTGGKTTESDLEQAVQNVVDALHDAHRYQPGRVGQASKGFRGLAGGLEEAPPPAAGVSTTLVDQGDVQRVTGAGKVATRDVVHIQSAEAVTLTWRMRRHQDPTDPAGDTVRTGVGWLRGDRTFIENAKVHDAVLKVVDGEYVRTIRVDTSDAPDGGVYLRPYTQVFGLDGVTDISLIQIGLTQSELPPDIPMGPRAQGPMGPPGRRGPQGVKGDPGNYYGITLIGFSDDLADRPASAHEGDFWGLIGEETLTLFVWTSGMWVDTGPLTTPPESFHVANTIHVQEGGSNANSGYAWSSAVRSIERALELADLRGEPTLIKWAPERPVVTQGLLDMPDETIIQSVHRSVVIRPDVGYETNNVFRMGSGCFLEGMLFEDWQVDSLTDPTSGFAVSFRPGAVIRRAPYAHKIAVRRTPTWGLVPPPLDRANGNPQVGNGGGVALADGSVCSQYSIYPNIMTWGATPVSQNGIGYCAKKGGLINAVNAVAIWSHKHFMALSGGQIILSACSTQFGDWSLVADGSRNVVVPDEPAGSYTAISGDQTTIQDAKSTIADAMWADLVAEGYTAGWTAEDEQFTKNDGQLFVQCIAWAVGSADVTPIQNFVRGLFDTEGAKVYDAAKEAAFIHSFEFMRDEINALGINVTSQTAVTNLTAAVTSTLTNPTFRKEPSKVTAIGHTWQNNLAGVVLSKIPPASASQPIRDSFLATNDGVIIATGQDELGRGLLASGPNGTLEVSPEQGLTGNLFDDAVQRIAMKTAIAGAF